MSDLLTTEQLAERWSCHPGSLANLRYTNDGPPYVTVGRRVRYRLADVEDYELANRKVPA